MNALKLIAAAALFVLSGIAASQTVKKYQLPDGRIVYTSDDMPNAKLLGTLAAPTPAQPLDDARKAQMQREKNAATQAAGKRASTLAAADAEYNAAVKALADARARLAAGEAPEEGERSGTVRGGGKGRANSDYADRQAALQKGVDAAQARLDKAIQARDAAR